MKKKAILSTLVFGLLLFYFAPVSGQSKAADRYNIAETEQPQGKTLVFLFLSEDDMFYIPFRGNGDKLTELVATVNHYKQLIADGVVTINVAGYSSGLPTRAENLASAKIRANRVKSELIVQNGIREANFATTVHAAPLDRHKSAVVVTLRVPQIEQTKPVVRPMPYTETKSEPVTEQPQKEQQAAVEQPKSEPVTQQASRWREPYRFAMRTNLLYDAFLVPTLGVEWRASSHVGIKVDGSLSRWGSADSKIQKIWLVSPEVRWYLTPAKRFYLGLGGNYGEYNVYKYMVGNLVSDDTGYQGKLYGGGLTAGYQARLARHWSLDFNLGLGYTRLDYDSFTLINGTRIYKVKDKTKNFWGPTQAGISLIWTIR